MRSCRNIRIDKRVYEFWFVSIGVYQLFESSEIVAWWATSELFMWLADAWSPDKTTAVAIWKFWKHCSRLGLGICSSIVSLCQPRPQRSVKTWCALCYARTYWQSVCRVRFIAFALSHCDSLVHKYKGCQVTLAAGKCFRRFKIFYEEFSRNSLLLIIASIQCLLHAAD